MNEAEESAVVPKLGFPEFRDSGGWAKETLGQLGELISGLTYHPDDIREAGLLVLRSSNIQNGAITLDDNVYVRADINNAKLSLENDILICVRNGSKALIGKNALIPKNLPLCTHGAFMTVLRAKKPHFVFQLLQSTAYEKQVQTDLGATINSINGTQLKKYIFSIPKDPREQQKITDCLTSLDDLITAENEKLMTLKVHKKGLMQQLFPDVDKNLPELRFPEFRDSSGWAIVELEKVVNYENGKAHEKNISESGKYIVVNSKFVSTEGKVKKLTNYANLLAYSGDILMVLSDVPNGKAIAKCYYVDKDETYTVNQRVCRLMPTKVYGLLLFHVLNRNNYFLNFDDGVKQTNLSKEVVLKCPLLLPISLKEQQKIADCLTSLEDLITAQAEKIEALKVHKKGLMQGLFPSHEVVSK